MKNLQLYYLQVEVFKRADQDQLKEIFSQVRTVEFFFIDCFNDGYTLQMGLNRGITFTICSISGSNNKQDSLKFFC